jgi:ankyrin repeat protein
MPLIWSFFSKSYWSNPDCATHFYFLPRTELTIKHQYHNIHKAIYCNDASKIFTLYQDGVNFKTENDFLALAIKCHCHLELFSVLHYCGVNMNSTIHEFHCKTPLELLAMHEISNDHPVFKFFINNNATASNKFMQHIILYDDITFFEENNYLDELDDSELLQCYYMAKARNKKDFMQLLKPKVKLDWFDDTIPFKWTNETKVDPYINYTHSDHSNHRLLHYACANGDLTSVMKYHNLGIKFEEKTLPLYEKETAHKDCLEYAIIFGNPHIVDHILEHSGNKFENLEPYVKLANEVNEYGIGKSIVQKFSHKKRKRGSNS